MCQLAVNFLSGSPLQLLIELISLTISTGMKFKTKLKKLRVTLGCFEPLIIDRIRLQNIELGLPVDHIEELQRKIQEGIVVVGKVSNLRPWSLHIWVNCCNCIKPDYAGQLDELHDAFKSILGRLRVRAVLQSDELVILARQIKDREDENGRLLEKILESIGSSSENHQEIVLERDENGSNAPISGEGGGTRTQVLHLAAVFQRLHEAIITLMKVKKKLKLKCVLEEFMFTMDCLKPLITEIAQPNSLLHLPKEEIDIFVTKLEIGVKLIYEYSDLFKMSDYIKGLYGLNDSCQRMFDTLRLQIEDVVIQSSVTSSNLWEGIKEIEESEVLQHQFEEVSEAEPQSPTVGQDVNTLESSLNLDVTVSQIQFGVDEPLPLVVESDAMNIYENSDSASNVDDEVEEIGGISGTFNQIEFGVADLVFHTNVSHAKNMYEDLDPARNVKEQVEKVQGKKVAQNQTEILAAKPLSDALNTCENLDWAKDTNAAKRIEEKGKQQRSRVPKFGNWEGEENVVPYTVKGKKGAAVPKFGEWDENNPAAADSFTHIFNKVREEKAGRVPGTPPQPSYYTSKPSSGKSCCCF